jgi:hypothetical protein
MARTLPRRPASVEIDRNASRSTAVPAGAFDHIRTTDGTTMDQLQAGAAADDAAAAEER